MRARFCALLFCALWVLACAHAFSGVFRRIAVNNAQQRHALCNDGTVYHYYRSVDGDPARWVIYLQSGSYCSSMKECLNRHKDEPWYTSSNHQPDTVLGSDLLSTDPTANPLFNSYSRLYLPYCSSDFWLGMGVATDDVEYNFAGAYIVQSVVEDVFQNPANVTEVVLAGSSAGGVGTANHLLLVRRYFPPITSVICILDSAWTVALGYKEIQKIVDGATKLWNTSSLSYCGETPCCAQTSCVLSQVVPKTIPIFVLQSQYDLQFLDDGLQPKGVTDGIQKLFFLSGALTTSFLASNIPLLSYVSLSCLRHQYLFGSSFTCYNGDVCDFSHDIGTYRLSWKDSNIEKIKVGETSVLDTLVRWYTNLPSNATIRVEDKCSAPMCNPTCTEHVVQILATDLDETATLLAIAGFLGLLLLLFLAFVIRGEKFLYTSEAQWEAAAMAANAPGSANNKSARTNKITLYFDSVELRYTKSAPRPTLNKVSGRILPGRLIGIMGPSGCGKTTLMKLLAGRQNPEFVTGTIRANGRNLYDGHNSKERKDTLQAYLNNVTYVEQLGDTLFERLTVQQTLLYAAALKLGTHHPDLHLQIAAALSDTHLQDCITKRVGQLSGGQRKRLAVACELVDNSRSLLFLDEPTTGLDASASLGLIVALKSIAVRRGCTIICTIHQPRPEIFRLLHEVIILAKGRLVYQGPPATALATLHPILSRRRQSIMPTEQLTFDTIMSLETGGGISIPMPDPSKPSAKADALLDLVLRAKEEQLDRAASAQTDKVREKEYNARQQSGAATSTTNNILTQSSSSIEFPGNRSRAPSTESGMPAGGPVPAVHDEFRLSKRGRQGVLRWIDVLAIMVSRFVRGYGVKPAAVELLVLLVTGAFVGMILRGLYASWTIASGLWVCLMSPSFLLNPGTCTAFCSSFRAHTHESLHRLYGAAQVALQHFIFQTAVSTVLCAALLAFVYWLTFEAATVTKFFATLAAVILTTLAWVSLFLFICVSLSANYQLATYTASAVMTVATFLAGYIISLNNMPYWLQWAPYLSPFYWGFSAIVVLNLKNQSFPCDSDSDLLCQDSNGSSTIVRFGYETVMVTVNLIVLFGFVVVFVVGSCLMLRRGLNRARSQVIA